MKTFSCQCGNRLFVNNSQCIRCGAEVGICPACHSLQATMSDDDSKCQCGSPDCGAELVRCGNSLTLGCNTYVAVTDDGATQAGDICEYCALTKVVPELSMPGNVDKLARLEQAKRRVLFGLDQLGLQYRPDDRSPELRFEFKADGDEPVHTGHDHGCITINIREADDVERERARVNFGEPQRTLVGHFRHELGHFFWDRSVKGRLEQEFRELFGDERNPDYQSALKAYYDNGPKADWALHYISAYASMHPWEDFAETFAAYLDLRSVLGTARHFGVVEGRLQDFDQLIVVYSKIGILANEFNRDLGLLDLVPEVLRPPIVNKLRFVHRLVNSTATRGTASAAPLSQTPLGSL